MKGLLRWAARRWHSNPSLVRLEQEVRSFADALPADALVLDAGAGDCRYRSRFARQRYEAADFAQVTSKEYGRIDYVCDLRAVPVEADRYDAIICTQVLAHMPDPEAVLREFRRILRPGGILLLSCPLFFQENEKPYDYYRYTQFGLRHLLGRAGLTIERLDWLEGYYGTLSYQLSAAAVSLPTKPTAYGGGVVGLAAAGIAYVLRLAFAAGCQLFTWLELRHKHTASGQCINYIVLARRPC